MSTVWCGKTVWGSRPFRPSSELLRHGSFVGAAFLGTFIEASSLETFGGASFLGTFIEASSLETFVGASFLETFGGASFLAPSRSFPS
jgi:hypothetical protein